MAPTPVHVDNDAGYQLPGQYETRGNASVTASVKAGAYGGSMERVARSMLGPNASQRDINNYVGQLLEINGIDDPRRVQAGQDILLEKVFGADPAGQFATRFTTGLVGREQTSGRSSVPPSLSNGVSFRHCTSRRRRSTLASALACRPDGLLSGH